jgi:hypothetical protein
MSAEISSSVCWHVVVTSAKESGISDVLFAL